MSMWKQIRDWQSLIGCVLVFGLQLNGNVTIEKEKGMKGKVCVPVRVPVRIARQKRYASKKIRRRKHLVFYTTNPTNNTLHKKRNNHEGTWHNMSFLQPYNLIASFRTLHLENRTVLNMQTS